MRTNLFYTFSVFRFSRSYLFHISTHIFLFHCNVPFYSWHSCLCKLLFMSFLLALHSCHLHSESLSFYVLRRAFNFSFLHPAAIEQRKGEREREKQRTLCDFSIFNWAKGKIWFPFFCVSNLMSAEEKKPNWTSQAFQK